MGGLSTYYYYTGVFFLLMLLCDGIFYFQFSGCIFDSNAVSFFMFLILINLIIFIMMMFSGYITNYFDQMDPDELMNLGWLKNILSIICKLSPTFCKLAHYLKVIIVLVVCYFCYFNNQSGVTVLSSADFYVTYPNLTLSCYNVTFVEGIVTQYKKQVVVFGTMELFFVFITLLPLGIIKNLIDINGYFYEPEDFSHGGCRTLLFRRFGP